MITRGLLDQLLKSGSDLLQGQAGMKSSSQPSGRTDSPLAGLLSGVGGGALGGSAIGLLMGNKKARKVGKKVATYGGLAALGVIAYKAYGSWQQRTGNNTVSEPQTIDRLPPPQVEEHSQAILRAVIGAAKADGHVDDRERELIEGEINKLTEDRELQSWFDQELRRPLDPAEIARAASTPEMAAEMYLASLLMVDEENYMERAYLDELARQLKLDPELKTELERQAEQSVA
ncbi:tellurite resistance TerB family protein [Pseudomonas sp. gcc21]|uniref:tellurite resistance TerB family protein n=1 Tax=Pseudomonas sp. gcc21 TaxID=2726989 RepID=UPI001452219A|nr:tellurite resistance TerB family protein [Pseudomonas sp. gcc21]QJD59910.1 tellurite resistance TerB family protein [Pseudomonas sp. gcc21]